MNIYILDNIFTDCTASSYLFQKVKTFFLLNNYLITNLLEEADYIVINTCGVWESTEKKYIEVIKDFHNKNKRAKIIIFGCLPKISEKIKKLDFIFEFIPLKSENIFDKIFYKNFSIENINPKMFDLEYFNKLNSSFVNNNIKKRFFIEISRGCIHNCSYCITKKSIGYVKSIKENKILDSVKFAQENGFQEIVLVSDDVTSYGKDIGTNFINLFNKMCEIPNLNFNINYAEPSEFMKIFPHISYNINRINEITLPVQSFSDNILIHMNRKYTIDKYINLIKKLRLLNPNIYITNHIIFGYPYETNDEFLDNIKGAKLFDTTLFSLYSYRKGTKKFLNSSLVSKIELKKRIEIILKLNKINSKMFNFGNKDDNLFF